MSKNPHSFIKIESCKENTNPSKIMEPLLEFFKIFFW